MVENLKFSCRCPNPSSHWIELPHHDIHRYRVECGACGKFIKWGKEQELHFRVSSRDKVIVTSLEDDITPYRKTIEDFL